MKRLLSALFACCAIFAPGLCASGAWAAGSAAAQGIALYKAKRYKDAAAQFEAAVKANPKDANTLYYCALTNQLSGNRARAKQLYEYIQTAFPGSAFATNAQLGLQSLGVSSSSTGPQPTGALPAARQSTSTVMCQFSGPTSFTLPFLRGPHNEGRGGVYVQVSVNHRPMTFHLDTGAGVTMIGSNQLADLGLARPANNPKFGMGGVGDRQDIKAWRQKVDLNLGPFYVRDFPITVQDYYSGEPLLGRDFLDLWDVSISESTREVKFNRKGAIASDKHPQARGTMDVPFVLEGRHMVVDGSVNGKPYKFYFDTGADGIAFSLDDVKRLGMEDALSTARQTYSTGVGGQTLTYLFPISEIKVGPIVKENITVGAVSTTQMKHPLLGQSFFGEYNYQIDEASHVIHFRPNY